MTLHVAVASLLDVRRLADELGLARTDGGPVPVGPGGYSVTEIVLGLASRVDRLDLVTLDPLLDRPAELVGPRVRLAVGPFRSRARERCKDLFAAERAFVAARLRTWAPDVVSAHWSYEYALGALDSSRPTLVTFRDWAPTILRYSPDPYRLVRLVMQGMVLARGRWFAGVSPYLARKVQRVGRRPVAVLPNALGESWFHARPTPTDAPRVLAINNGFHALKNVQRLLEAFRVVREHHPAAELALAGQGYEPGGSAQLWSDRHGLACGVRFLGPVPRQALPDLFRGTTVFAHPSLEESFGMVVLEAMACGVPVVGGNRSGAVPWLLSEGAGVLVDVRRPHAIATGLMALLEHPDYARATAEIAHARAQESFTATAVAGDYLRELTKIHRSQGQGGRNS